MSDSAIDKSLICLFPLLIYVFFIQALGFYNLYTPWFFTFYYIIIGFSCYAKIQDYVGVKLLFLLWILYILISGLTADLPARYMAEEFKRFIAPTLFVYVGMYSKKDDIYKYYIYSIFVSVVVGFVLLIQQPAWYINFLIECFNNTWYADSSEDASSIMETAFRFQSFFVDSYAISYFVSFALCIVLCDIYKTNSILKSQKIKLLYLIVFVVAIILSGFRVAMAYMLLAFLWMLAYGIVTKNPHKKIFVGAVIAFFAFVLAIFVFLSDNEYFSFLKENLTERLSDMSFENAMEGSRNAQKEKVLESWQDIIFGDGTSSKGAQARIDELPAITDGGYVKMLVENGIVGVSIFAMIILITIRKCLANLRYYMVELLIIGYVLVSMLGANSLAMHWCFVILFWFAVGRVWNEYVLTERILNDEEV
jgi:hypothetical protein